MKRIAYRRWRNKWRADRYLAQLAEALAACGAKGEVLEHMAWGDFQPWFVVQVTTAEGKVGLSA